MSAVSDTINATEAIGIILLLYVVYKSVNKVQDAFTLAGAGATVTGTQDWIATTTPLTAQHADSLARFIGPDLHGGGWQLSPDGTQIWFFDGSFFDNKTGHFFDSSGVDRGNLLGNGGDTSPSPIDSIDFSQAI